MSSFSSPPASSRPLAFEVLAAGAVAFLTLGVLQAIYGPAFPAFEERYGIPTSQVGLIASAHFVGSASAPPLVGLLLTRLTLGQVVGSAFILLALGVILVALAPSWPLALLGALIGGLGLGGVSGGLNAAYASVGTQAINFVNAVFGVGSMAAPLLLTFTRQTTSSNAGLPLAFGTIAALAGLGLIAARLWGFPTLQSTPSTEAGPPRRSNLLLFAAILLLYVGLEVGTGAWAAKHLSTLGHSNPALIVSGFWGGLTVSRILTSLFGARIAPGRLVLLAAILSAAAAALAVLPAFAPLAYILVGLACGPIFPTTLAWVAQQLPPRFVTFLLVGGSTGGILMPWLLGLGFTGLGGWAVPAFLCVTALLLSVLVAIALRR